MSWRPLQSVSVFHDRDGALDFVALAIRNPDTARVRARRRRFLDMVAGAGSCGHGPAALQPLLPPLRRGEQPRRLLSIVPTPSQI